MPNRTAAGGSAKAVPTARVIPAAQKERRSRFAFDSCNKSKFSNGPFQGYEEFVTTAQRTPGLEYRKLATPTPPTGPRPVANFSPRIPQRMEPAIAIALMPARGQSRRSRFYVDILRLHVVVCLHKLWHPVWN